jgi:hypothetical protein
MKNVIEFEEIITAMKILTQLVTSQVVLRHNLYFANFCEYLILIIKIATKIHGRYSPSSEAFSQLGKGFVKNKTFSSLIRPRP